MVIKDPLPDERVVFLILKNVFKGQNAEVRQPRAIHKLIKEHQKLDAVADLVREHNFDIVCNAARVLLCDDIFASTLKAKIRFPELFDLSPTQSAEKEASEAEAAKHEADAIALAIKGLDPFKDGIPGAITQVTGGMDALSPERLFPSTVTPTPNGPGAQVNSIPRLFPVYLPFTAQHAILVHLQKLLESICYAYGKEKMPDILQNRGWDCAESVELNRWTEEFLKIQHRLLGDTATKTPLDQLLRSVANIRHTAVHRIKVNSRGIEQFLLDAEALTKLLGDIKNTEQIAKLRRATQAATDELQRNKQFVRSRLEDTLRGIEARHKELDCLRDAAIAEMEREEAEYQILAGKSVDDAIAPSVASFSTAFETEREDVTRANDTDDTDRDGAEVEQPEATWDMTFPVQVETI